MPSNPPPISQLSNFMTVRQVRATNLTALTRSPTAVTSGTLDVASSAPRPPIGTVNPGELLIDAQYKTMWLGVDPSVDVTQSLLLCDMAALLGVDQSLLDEAKAYTDAAVALRAPLKHTHPHTDITDWEQAINVAINASAANWQRGMIQMFSGNAANIGFDWRDQGGVNLLGWALCNGSNGTPDLQDKFVIGAGNKSVGSSNVPVNGVKQGNTDVAGSHSHGGYTGNTYLDANQLPPHTHSLAGHTHKVDKLGKPKGYELVTSAYNQVRSHFDIHEGLEDTATMASGDGTFTGANTTANSPHRHEIFNEAGHQHTIPADFYNTGMPWYALAYIMKL